MKNDELLHKWIENTISEEELIIFKQRPEFQELQEIYQGTDNLTVPTFDQNTVLSTILNSQKIQPKGEAKILSLRNILKFSAAACALLILGFFVWPESEQVYLDVAQGQKLTNTLPDGSEVYMNAESQLSYNAKNWDKERLVRLIGEAQFSVKKGERFIVESNTGSVEVLGTVFNIKDRGNQYEVSCTEGKVSVKLANSEQEYILTAGKSIEIKNGKDVLRTDKGALHKNSWTKGVSRFENAELRSVLDEIERQYAVQIKSDNIDLSEKMSCNFRHDNIEVALKTVTLPLGLTFVIKDKEILISK